MCVLAKLVTGQTGLDTQFIVEGVCILEKLSAMHKQNTGVLSNRCRCLAENQVHQNGGFVHVVDVTCACIRTEFL